MRARAISTILKEVGGLKKNDEKVQALKSMADNTTLKTIIQYTYHPGVKWRLPEGVPPFTPSPYLDQEGNLYSEVRKLYLFVENGGADNLSQFKREMLWIQLLEMLIPADAEMLCNMKDGKKFKGISDAVVREAFPELLQ